MNKWTQRRERNNVGFEGSHTLCSVSMEMYCCLLGPFRQKGKAFDTHRKVQKTEYTQPQYRKPIRISMIWDVMKASQLALYNRTTFALLCRSIAQICFYLVKVLLSLTFMFSSLEREEIFRFNKELHWWLQYNESTLRLIKLCQLTLQLKSCWVDTLSREAINSIVFCWKSFWTFRCVMAGGTIIWIRKWLAIRHFSSLLNVSKLVKVSSRSIVWIQPYHIFGKSSINMFRKKRNIRYGTTFSFVN